MDIGMVYQIWKNESRNRVERWVGYGTLTGSVCVMIGSVCVLVGSVLSPLVGLCQS